MVCTEKIEQGGAPFFNYIKMDADEMEIEIGNPTNSFVNGDSKFKVDLFPFGKYPVASYTGPYNKLFEV